MYTMKEFEDTREVKLVKLEAKHTPLRRHNVLRNSEEMSKYAKG